jgi:MFS family permease
MAATTSVAPQGVPWRGALLSARSAMTFVVLLSLVSLFADMTYEGGRSLTGQYLKLLGASATAVSVVAGAGELLGYGLRFFSGYVADRSGRYWSVAFVGYTLNLFAVPLLALTGRWPSAAGLMFLERIGKGIRNPSRDAMLSHATQEMGRGWGFGLHEAMDSTGACLGPLFVAAVLAWSTGGAALAGYHTAFAVLAIPAALALGTLVVARFRFPRPADLESKTPKLSVHGFTAGYWLYVVAAGLVGAGYADFQLVAYHLKAAAIAPDQVIPLLYALAMGTTGVAALAAGRLFDRVGPVVLPAVVAAGVLFAPLAFLGSLPVVILGIVLWGIGLAAQESVMAAALADLIPIARRAYGYGLFHTVFGVFWFAGSVLMGVLYDRSPLALVVFSVGVQLAALPLFALARARATRTLARRTLT